MNHNQNRKTKPTYCLGDLICAVSAFARNDIEAAAAVEDLFSTGRVRLALVRSPRRRR